MKAILIYEFGGPDKVTLGEVSTPEPGLGEVRIKVKAAALNHLDIWVRRGRVGTTLAQGHILGSDAAGVIDKVGPGANGLLPGQEVVVLPGISCQHCEWCLRGEQSECAHYKLLGFQLEGTCAEYLVVPALNVAPKPAHLDWPEAAALSLSHLTAWRMLFARAGLKAGEMVLIHGIGGGVALAALQWCVLTGATAIVTSSSDAKLKRAANLGAAHGINYKTADVAPEVRRLTKERGVDVVLDTVGAATLSASMNSVRRGGRIVTCGVTSGARAAINLQQLYWYHITLMGSTMGSADDYRGMLREVSQAKLRPVMDRVFPMEQYSNAVQSMEDGVQFGKIAFRIA